MSILGLHMVDRSPRSSRSHEELVFEALSYRRNVGARLSDIRAYLAIRRPSPRRAADDLETLRALETDGKVMRLAKRWYLTSAGWKAATGPALQPQWQAEDAWILLAITYGSRGAPATLDEVIAAADYINHAIPTLDEMHGAINRLVTAKLVSANKEAFAPTGSGLALVRKTEEHCRQGVLEIWRGLSRMLVCPCCGFPLKTVKWRIFIDQPTFDACYKKYLNAMRRD